VTGEEYKNKLLKPRTLCKEPRPECVTLASMKGFCVKRLAVLKRRRRDRKAKFDARILKEEAKVNALSTQHAQRLSYRSTRRNQQLTRGIQQLRMSNDVDERRKQHCERMRR